jgi:hypothetical protein
MFKYYKTVTRYNGYSVYTKHDAESRRKLEYIWESVRVIQLQAEALESQHVKDI